MLKKYTPAAVPMMLAILLMLIPISCGDDGPSPEVWTDVTRTDTYSGSGDQVFLVDTTGNVNLTYTLDVGEVPREVYFIFTNTTMSDAGSNPVVKSVDGEEPDSAEQIMSDDSGSASYSRSASINDLEVPHSGKPHIDEFNQNPFVYITNANSTLSRSLIQLEPPLYDAEDQSSSFYDDNGISIPATCRKVVYSGSGKPVTLNIWVADNCWDGTECTRTNCVTQTMVDTLASKFLLTGDYNDIYEWITNIFGIEWGTHSYPSQLIPDNNEITILLYDIDADNTSTSGVLGFFYSRDNFFRVLDDNKLKYSNQRVMFYLDSVIYAAKEGTWDVADPGPSLIISTLAHEFQHMINFYQKNVLRVPGGSGPETWLNEMCSMVAEDLVATKLQVDGPRGVSYLLPGAGLPGNNEGRLPLYNYYNYVSIVRWLTTYPEVLRSYSANYAFGAYLARNFGGAPFMQKLVQNQYTDFKAINYALTQSGYSEDFASVLRKWGAANLLSDSTSPPSGYYQYNSGTWFTSTIGSISYDLGSINLYNYTYSGQTGPRYFTSSIPYGKEAGSNIYYRVGSNLTGTITRSITMEDNIKLTVVVKE